MKASHVLAGVLCTMLSSAAFAQITRIEDVVVTAGGIGGNPHITDMGYFKAGFYSVQSGGNVGVTGNPGLALLPDGTPADRVTQPGYEYFNDYGSYTINGAYGIAGKKAKIGALIGTFDPTRQSDWFYLGYSASVRVARDSHLYIAVNDSSYSDNLGAFSVDVRAGAWGPYANDKVQGMSVSAVPEPESYAMLLAGLGLLGFTARRKKDKASV